MVMMSLVSESLSREKKKQKNSSDGLIDTKWHYHSQLSKRRLAITWLQSSLQRPQRLIENIALLHCFSRLLMKNVTNCDNGRKAVHYSTTNLFS